MQFLHLAVGDIAFVVTFSIFPTSSFHEQTVNVDTFRRLCQNFCQVAGVSELASIRHKIERELIRSRRCLHDRCHKGHGIEKAAEPKRLQKGTRLSANTGPLDELGHTFQQVYPPCCQGLQRWECQCSPKSVDLVD